MNRWTCTTCGAIANYDEMQRTIDESNCEQMLCRRCALARIGELALAQDIALDEYHGYSGEDLEYRYSLNAKTNEAIDRFQRAIDAYREAQADAPHQ